MRNYLYPKLNADPRQRAIETVKAVEEMRRSGTDKRPQPPRDVTAQPSVNAIEVYWKLPEVWGNIVGWRVYVGDEETLLKELSDRAVRHYTVPATSGASPPVVNIFISAITPRRESAKIQVQGSASAWPAGAAPPAVAAPPPGYTAEAAGGVNKTSGREPREPRYINGENSGRVGQQTT